MQATVYVIYKEYMFIADVNREGDGTPLQYSCLENPTDGGAWWVAVHGVARSRTWLGDFTFTFHFHALVKEMAIHSIVLAWRIPWTGEPGGLPSMGSHRIGHNWSDLAAAAANRGICHIPNPKALPLNLLGDLELWAPFPYLQNNWPQNLKSFLNIRKIIW